MLMTYQPADPDAPFDILRSHLQRDMLKKSTSSCRAALIYRCHRSACLQELLCDSWEEHEVALNVAALPDVSWIREQAVTVPFENAKGRQTTQRIDLLCFRNDGRIFAVSVKYAAKARRASYLAEIAALNKALPVKVADRAVVLSRESFHAYHNQNAQLIHIHRRSWDPEADRITLEAAQEMRGNFRLDDLYGRTRLDIGRTFRSAVRLIGDGDIRLPRIVPINDETVCKAAA